MPPRNSPTATSHRIQRAAAALRRRGRGVPLGALPDDARPRDEDEGYAVQRAVHAGRAACGEGRRVGWKVGCTSPQMQAYLGIDHPCAGGVPGAGVREGAGTFRHGDFVRPGVECEIAVRLGSPLRASDGPFAPDDVRGAVARVMAALEVVDDRYEDRTSLDLPTLVADDFFHAGCVLGAPRAPGGDLGALAGELRIDGRPGGRGEGRSLLGDPLRVLAWLASHPTAAGGSLAAGEFVLLGSLVEVFWVAPGAVAEADFGALGRARARFT